MSKKFTTNKEFADDFAKRADTGKSAKYVVRLIAAIQAKILAPTTTLSVAQQTAKHGMKLIANAKSVNDLNAVESVSEFLDKAFNIKAFDYVAVLASKDMNDYLALTINHLKSSKSSSRGAVKAVMSKYYGKGTVDAQSSMTITALRALKAINSSSQKDAPIERGENFDAICEIMGNHQVARPVINP